MAWQVTHPRTLYSPGATIPTSFFQSVRKGFPQTRVYVHDLTLFDDIESWFCRQQIYGMTETSGAVGGFGKDGASHKN